MDDTILLNFYKFKNLFYTHTSESPLRQHSLIFLIVNNFDKKLTNTAIIFTKLNRNYTFFLNFFSNFLYTHNFFFNNCNFFNNNEFTAHSSVTPLFFYYFLNNLLIVRNFNNFFKGNQLRERTYFLNQSSFIIQKSKFTKTSPFLTKKTKIQVQPKEFCKTKTMLLRKLTNNCKNYKVYGNYAFSQSKIFTNISVNLISINNKKQFWLNLFFLKKINLINLRAIAANKLKNTIYSRKSDKNAKIAWKDNRYTTYSKFFFFGLDFEKNFFQKREVGVFLFQPQDFVNEHLIKLTKNSTNLNQPDILTIPQWALASNKLHNFFSIQLGITNSLFIINNTWINDDTFESNYAFLTRKISHLRATFNKHFDLTTLIECKNKLSADKDNIDNNFFELNENSTHLRAKKSTHFNFNLQNIFINQNVNARNERTYPNLRLNSQSSKTQLDYFYKISKTEISLFLQTKPFYFKFFFLKNNNHNSLKKFFNVFNENIFTYLTNYFFYAKTAYNLTTNVLPSNAFISIIKKYVIKSFNYQKFPIITSSWHYTTLIKFLEFCSGKSVLVNIFSFLNNILNLNELLRCEIWAQKLKSFRKSLGPKLFLAESLRIIYISLKLKDPYFLSNWLLNFFYKISFWKYKLVFRYLQYILRYFFWPIFKEISLKGLKFQLKGKVSVAGNARTRTVMNKIGRTSHATFNNKVLYNLNLIKTFTGVIGFKTWLIF